MVVFAQSQNISSWDSCMVDGVPTLSCLEIVFSNILTMSVAFIVLILFIMFVFGGFQYLTSFGNADKIKKAQATLKYALIGFILFVSSYLILKIIDILFLGGDNKIFEFNLQSPE
ncbi:MAG: hypothetical protein N2593_00335 [Patescibacteria group bacterium]|nr:hypothetical protein [Patescibacteria group bacterium]